MCDFRLVVRRTFLTVEEICSQDFVARRSSSAPPVSENHRVLRQPETWEPTHGSTVPRSLETDPDDEVSSSNDGMMYDPIAFQYELCQRFDQQREISAKISGFGVSGLEMKNPDLAGFEPIFGKHSKAPCSEHMTKMACAKSTTQSHWPQGNQRQATMVPSHKVSPVTLRSAEFARALVLHAGVSYCATMPGDRAGNPDKVVAPAPEASNAGGNDLMEMCEGLNRTTVMIRGIPLQYQEEELKAEIRSLGFINAFDFVFLQRSKKGLSNRGFAFVNFKNPFLALQCFNCLSGHVWRKHRTSEVQAAAVSWAMIQGLEENVRARRRALPSGHARFHSLHPFKRCTKEWKLRV
mmetsp:Transcript_72534/g.143830  ORF Transcript_72534/g.143830 Transcript_72534/m.143830 type:complete len:351 (+) Transcript_72534:73-1125(+)|eukprot:CAMPEP_0172712936 /NCGR_PEP_ID=MMETSP1074-20121228/61389_1 /TAXON_ID=2916 /ORGANISM="Ceratium fusus, Strain PA161109" /LENGTH=350 /DNA_ID=CAMNT_0013536941 /DNA_START=53 /DNA_END=1105 /DNA_ORIENTATION=-